VKLTTHLNLVPRSKNEWGYTSTLPVRLHGMVLLSPFVSLSFPPYLYELVTSVGCFPHCTFSSWYTEKSANCGSVLCLKAPFRCFAEGMKNYQILPRTTPLTISSHSDFPVPALTRSSHLQINTINTMLQHSAIDILLLCPLS
jgi:hypothetical protein